jgi:membrane-associated phospholipid phosphatase
MRGVAFLWWERVLPSQTRIEYATTSPARRLPDAAMAVTAELVAGAILLAAAALAGLVFVRRPWPNRLDAWGYRVLPANLTAGWAHAFVGLGSMSGLLGGVLVVFLIGILRDRVRAVACASAPVLAVLIVQDIAKPLVDRHGVLSGGLSYPSGTVAAVAALATAITLVMPARTRLPLAVLGCLAIVGTSAAVVVLRWHYPTDALGGAAVGVGSVLVIDALTRGARVVIGLLDRWAPGGVNVPATTGGGSIGTLAPGTGRGASCREFRGMGGHAQVHHHGNSRERERDTGQVAGR